MVIGNSAIDGRRECPPIIMLATNADEGLGMFSSSTCSRCSKVARMQESPRGGGGGGGVKEAVSIKCISQHFFHPHQWQKGAYVHSYEQTHGHTPFRHEH